MSINKFSTAMLIKIQDEAVIRPVRIFLKNDTFVFQVKNYDFRLKFIQISYIINILLN